MQQLRQMTPTRESFKFPMSTEEAMDILTACYRIEVEERGRTCVLDQPTRDHIYKLARWVTDPTDTHFGVMLIGGLGNGKTTLMRALERALWYINKDESFNQQQDAQLFIRNAKAITEQDKYIKSLGIDDLGTEPIEQMAYGNVITPTTDLLYHRYEKRLFTVVTTNLALQPNDSGVPTLRQRYGDRLADRMNEMFHVIPFYNNSYR